MRKILLILTLVVCIGLIACTNEESLRNEIEKELYTSLSEEISITLEGELRQEVKNEILAEQSQKENELKKQAYQHYFVKAENAHLTENVFQINTIFFKYEDFASSGFYNHCQENNIEIDEKAFDNYFIITVSAGARSAQYINEAFYRFTPHFNKDYSEYLFANTLNYYAEYDLLGESESGYYIILVPKAGIEQEMLGWDSVILKEVSPVTVGDNN